MGLDQASRKPFAEAWCQCPPSHSAAVSSVVVAVSGSGRSLANLLAFQDSRAVGYRITGVISSRPDVKAVQIAESHKLPLFVANFSPSAQTPTMHRDLDMFLSKCQAEWVALAGFLKLFPVPVRLQGRVINIHPALLPRHGGKGMYGDWVHAAVLAAGDKESGATIHFVSEHYDEGAPIAQVIVKTERISDPHELAGRVFEAECDLYPKVLSGLAWGLLPRPGGTPIRYEFQPEP